MRIYCKNCGQPLTLELQEATPEALEAETIEVSEDYETEGDLVKRGFWFDNDTESRVVLGNANEPNRYANAIGVNLDDCLGLKTIDDRNRAWGCCGLDGCDGKNTQCEKCGAEVATELSDCWTGRVMLFDKNAIRTGS